MLEKVVDKFKTSLGALNQMCELVENLTGVNDPIKQIQFGIDYRSFIDVFDKEESNSLRLNKRFLLHPATIRYLGDYMAKNLSSILKSSIIKARVELESILGEFHAPALDIFKKSKAILEKLEEKEGHQC